MKLLPLSSLLLPTMAALATSRMPVSVYQLMDRFRRDQWRPSAGEFNSSDAAANTPISDGEKKNTMSPKPPPGLVKRGENSIHYNLGYSSPPVWTKRRDNIIHDLLSETPSDHLKRSPATGPPLPPVWTKRSYDPQSPRPLVKRNEASAAATADDDEFGLPLTPDDFSAAVRLAADALLAAPDATDPTQMAGLYEGDIAHVGGGAGGFEAAADDADDGGTAGGRTRNAVRGQHRLWPGGELPYTISSSFSGQERAVIAAAAQQLSQRSCLRLVPRAGQTDYVHITKGRGCSSDVGRFGGRQELSLGTGCVYRGVVAHEMLHAAGFWHEQSRADRDQHVIIHHDNIRAGMASNFDRKPWSQTLDLGEPYDVGSVLHYGPTAFAADPSRPTITPLVPSARMGQRDGPSDLDIAKLSRLYGCDESPTEAPQPEPAVCEDTNEACSSWAEDGECEKNPNWMKFNCALSCGTCDACEDRSDSCAGWAADNQCTTSWSFMSVLCRRACGLCQDGAGGGLTGCGDTTAQCTEWAKAGECAINPDYMTVHCRKACGEC